MRTSTNCPADPEPSESRVRGHLESHYADLLRLAEARVGDQDQARELLQEAALRALRKHSTLRDPNRVGPWIRSILRRTIGMFFRRRRRRNAALGRISHEIGFQLPVATGPDEPVKPCRCVLRALEQLSEDSQNLMKAVAIQGIPPGVYASRLGITSGNARIRLFRAKGTLRRALEDHCRQGCDLPVLSACGCAGKKTVTMANTGIYRLESRIIEAAESAPRLGGGSSE